MALSIHFTSGTVKDVAAAWHRAVQRGAPRPRTRITALRLRGRATRPRKSRLVSSAPSPRSLPGSRPFWCAGVPAGPTGPALVARRSYHGAKSPPIAPVRHGPQAAGYTTGAWSRLWVQTLIQQQFGVWYNVHYGSALLHNLGYSYQQARFVSDQLDAAIRTTWLAEQ